MPASQFALPSPVFFAFSNTASARAAFAATITASYFRFAWSAPCVANSSSEISVDLAFSDAAGPAYMLEAAPISSAPYTCRALYVKRAVSWRGSWVFLFVFLLLLLLALTAACCWFGRRATARANETTITIPDSSIASGGEATSYAALP